jgi:hypothetical protein
VDFDAQLGALEEGLIQLFLDPTPIHDETNPMALINHYEFSLPLVMTMKNTWASSSKD